jgi:hypothetical protein
MAVLTLTLTVPDSHSTMIEVLGMDSTQVDLIAIQNLMDMVINGTQVAEVVVDLDGSPVVTIPK